MTSSAESIVATFEHLSRNEQVEVVTKLCELASRWDSPPLSDEALSEIAAETFRQLDQQEAT
jgi:hypothetical protein